MDSSTSKRKRKVRKPNKKISAEWVANDNNLMTEILVRLPVQSIIKCKRVSTQIRSLISFYFFVRRFHELRQPKKKNNVSGLFIDTYCLDLDPARTYISLNGTDENTKPRVTIPGNFPKDDDVNILHSSNGLFLCNFRLEDILGLEPDSELFVCNATMKQFIRIPLPRLRTCSQLRELALAFDPLRSPEYEVVALWDLWGQYFDTWGAEVYSSADRSWRPAKGMDFPTDSSFGQLQLTGVYHSGAIYWIRSKFLRECSNVEENYTALYFDVDEERLQPLVLPPTPAGASVGKTDISYLGSCGDHLLLIMEYRQANGKYQFVVFEMNTDTSSWLVKYVINFNDINVPNVPGSSGAFPVVLKPPKTVILNISQGEAEDDLVLVIGLPDKIFCYSAKNKTSRLLLDRSSKRLFNRHMTSWRYVYQYHETIYPVDGRSISAQE